VKNEIILIVLASAAFTFPYHQMPHQWRDVFRPGAWAVNGWLTAWLYIALITLAIVVLFTPV
jgi:hypothetical protein